MRAALTPEMRSANSIKTNKARSFKIGAWAKTSGHLAHLAEFHRGHKRSLETREKLSAASRRRMAVNPQAFRAFVEAGGRAVGNQRRGKTYEEIYGSERAAVERKKRLHLREFGRKNATVISRTKKQWWSEHPEAKTQLAERTRVRWQMQPETRNARAETGRFIAGGVTHVG